jgi:hypothetical protein
MAASLPLASKSMRQKQPCMPVIFSQPISSIDLIRTTDLKAELNAQGLLLGPCQLIVIGTCVDLGMTSRFIVIQPHEILCAF